MFESIYLSLKRFPKCLECITYLSIALSALTIFNCLILGNTNVFVSTLFYGWLGLNISCGMLMLSVFINNRFFVWTAAVEKKSKEITKASFFPIRKEVLIKIPFSSPEKQPILCFSTNNQIFSSAINTELSSMSFVLVKDPRNISLKKQPVFIFFVLSIITILLFII